MAIAILGSTSAIGQEISKILAAQGHDLVLFSRRPADETVRQLDVLDVDHQRFRDDLQSAGPLLGVILCVGYLGDNLRAFDDPDEAALITDTNYTGCAEVLDIASSVIEPGGFMVTLSSVAADRPRRKVFYYGKAKAALNQHIERMHSRLSRKGIRVVTVMLGSVDTRMAAKARKHPFVLSAPDAARLIVDAAERADGVVYLPRKWKLIMGVMKLVPASLYNRI